LVLVVALLQAAVIQYLMLHLLRQLRVVLLLLVAALAHLVLAVVPLE
jgi:hypothetical protein